MMEIGLDAPLSRLGYIWAFALHIKKHWPTVPLSEAAMWCTEEWENGTTFQIGDPCYSWTVRDARTQADQYMEVCGEATQ